MQVQEFYDKISRDYSDLLRKAVPRYDEMLNTITEYLPGDFNPDKILELGSGSGNLTEKLVLKFPESIIEIVDISEEFIDLCKIRFKNKTNITYHQKDFKELNFSSGIFDLVVSSISIHHIKNPEKITLFKMIYKILKSGGKFIFVDQTMGNNSFIYKKHIDNWHKQATYLGSSEKDWKLWMEHQHKHDYHATISEHFEWLQLSGFKNIDILWKNLLWTIFYSEKL